MRNAQNRHVPFPSHMEQTVMPILSRSKPHSPRPGIFAPITFQQHGTTKNDHRSCKCHFIKQTATPALHNSDSLTTLRAISQCDCPLRPQHTHVKQTWRSELVKVKALKYKSSCTTGVNLLLSSYTSANLANLLYTHIHQRHFWLKNVFSITSVCNTSITVLQYYNCIQYFHYRTYFSITIAYNTSITERTSVLQLHTLLPLQNVLQYYNCIQYFHYRTYFSITIAYNTSITERTSVLQLHTILPQSCTSCVIL